MFKVTHHHYHHADPEVIRRLDIIIEQQEFLMSAVTDLQAALAALHQTIVDDITQENTLLHKIADANAANDSDAIVALVRQATQDNADLRASIDKSKAATDAAAAKVVSGDTIVTTPGV